MLLRCYAVGYAVVQSGGSYFSKIVCSDWDDIIPKAELERIQHEEEVRRTEEEERERVCRGSVVNHYLIQRICIAGRTVACISHVFENWLSVTYIALDLYALQFFLESFRFAVLAVIHCLLSVLPVI